MAWSWFWAVGFVFLGAAGALGCDSGETTEGPTCPDDPAEGPVLEECGIWVSAAKGDDMNKGKQAAPVATLARAIELAEKGPRRVYACGETWTEVVMVPSGVSVHGGFDCEDGWAYEGEPARGKLLSIGPTAITWYAGESQEMAYFTDFHVESADAIEPGGSSIALFIRDWLPLTIRRAELVGGNGADGLDGAPADDEVPPLEGAPGNPGADACSGPVSPGGAPAETTCAEGISRGGKGGDSGPSLAENGAKGEPDDSGGYGGLGEAKSPTCTAGVAGRDGEAGDRGLGGGWIGRLTPEGYLGSPGEDGELGLPGQGGGGGGAVFGSAAVCGMSNPGGAAGGSGGAGGCGGKPGKAGQAGGSSFAFATRANKDIHIESVVFRVGNGGNGGNGGAPQLGGIGGIGGAGGKGAGTIPGGCPGGAGGLGGPGGWGGGGAGGHSVPIVFLWGTATIREESNEYHGGTPGKGGNGSPQDLGGKGATGIYGIEIEADP